MPIAELVSHVLRSWSNAQAPAKVYAKPTTLDVSQPEIFALNAAADPNKAAMFVTELTSHFEMSALKRDWLLKPLLPQLTILVT